MVPVYVVLVVPPSLVGLAAVLAVIRAKKEGLPAIVRALTEPVKLIETSGSLRCLW
jgi:hypothetical protein